MLILLCNSTQCIIDILDSVGRGSTISMMDLIYFTIQVVQ